MSDVTPPLDPSNSIDALIISMGLQQINDIDALSTFVDKAITDMPKNVQEYKAGNTKALNGLFGYVMRVSKGRANPVLTNTLLISRLCEGGVA